MFRILMVAILGIVLSGCAANYKDSNTFKGELPYIEGTPTNELLKNIPKLDGQPKITIAVYRFMDLTGQRKPSTKFSLLSTAVTQCSDAFVISALKSVSETVIVNVCDIVLFSKCYLYILGPTA